LYIGGCIESFQVRSCVSADFAHGLVLGEAYFGEAVKDIEPEQATGIDHVSVAFSERITGILGLGDDLCESIHERF
jgi:hypothetical protein